MVPGDQHPDTRGARGIILATEGNTSGSHVRPMPLDTIADMNLYPAAEAEVIEASTRAGVL